MSCVTKTRARRMNNKHTAAELGDATTHDGSARGHGDGDGATVSSVRGQQATTAASVPPHLAHGCAAAIAPLQTVRTQCMRHATGSAASAERAVQCTPPPPQTHAHTRARSRAHSTSIRRLHA
jgi:hypothetical protein